MLSLLVGFNSRPEIKVRATNFSLLNYAGNEPATLKVVFESLEMFFFASKINPLMYTFPASESQE
jgi:hypothetical protein